MIREYRTDDAVAIQGPFSGENDMEQANELHSAKPSTVDELAMVRDLRIALGLARYPEIAPLNDALRYLGCPVVSLDDGITVFWEAQRDIGITLAVRSADLFGAQVGVLKQRLFAGTLSETQFAAAVAALLPLLGVPG